MNNSQKRSARLLELMPLIKAHAEGKIIEFKRMDGIWTECYANGPSWSAGDEYRVKPEPRTVTVLVDNKGKQVRSWYSWDELKGDREPATVLATMNSSNYNSSNKPFSLITFNEAK